MTTGPVATADAAHAAATTAIEELYAEAISALDALFRSFEKAADAEQGTSEPVQDEIRPVEDRIVGPVTLELPRRIIRPAFPVTAAA